MTDNEKRPPWPFSFPEEYARWLAANHVVKITHHWRYTSVDTSENWVELHNAKGKSIRARPFDRLIKFDATHHAGLVTVDDTVRDAITAIDRFEQRNARDRAEYNRLRAKFERDVKT